MAVRVLICQNFAHGPAKQEPPGAGGRPREARYQPPQAARRRRARDADSWPSCTRLIPHQGLTMRSAARPAPPSRTRWAAHGDALRPTPATRPAATPTFAAGARRSTTPPTASTRPRSCATSTTARPAGSPAAGCCASGRSGRPGQGDRGRARGQLPGLDLQRPGARADAALPRGRAAADPLRQRLRRTRTRSTSTASTRRSWTACPGSARPRRRHDRAGRELHLRVRRRPVRPAPLPLPRRAARRAHRPAASTAPSSSTRKRRARRRPTSW